MCLSSVQNNLLNEHLANAKSSYYNIFLDLSISLSKYHIALCQAADSCTQKTNPVYNVWFLILWWKELIAIRWQPKVLPENAANMELVCSSLTQFWFHRSCNSIISSCSPPHITSSVTVTVQKKAVLGPAAPSVSFHKQASCSLPGTGSHCFTTSTGSMHQNELWSLCDKFTI